MKVLDRLKKIGKGIGKGIGKPIPSKIKNKQILKEQKQVTIVENQPVYTQDRNRYFKQAWKEERRQLFFK